MTTTVDYEPRGAARELFSARDAEILLDGPAGTGKSLAALYRLHMACLKYPKIKCLVVRKTQKSLAATTLVTYEEQVASEAMTMGVVTWFGGSGREPACYRYSNGSRIVVGGMDNPDKIMSSAYDLIFADEATELTIDDWEKLGTRNRNGRLPWQQQIAACNPGPPHHWMNTRAEAGKMHRLLSRHSDNPWCQSPVGSAYLQRISQLTGVRYLRLYKGIWAAAEGLIYEEFDPSIHMVDQFDIPDSWPRYWCIDFGFSNPFVCQWWAEDPDGRLYLYREIYMTGRLVEDHAAQIARIVYDEPVFRGGQWTGTWKEPRPTAIICDHDAEGRETLRKHLGIGTTAANKKVIDGIQKVKGRLKVAGDGKPRMLLMRDALVERDQSLVLSGKPTCTAEEITGYIWEVKRGDEVQETPRKQDDHGMDTMRYVTAFRDLRARYAIDSW